MAAAQLILLQCGLNVDMRIIAGPVEFLIDDAASLQRLDHRVVGAVYVGDGYDARRAVNLPLIGIGRRRC